MSSEQQELWDNDRISSEAAEATDELDGGVYVHHVIRQLLIKMKIEYEARLRTLDADIDEAWNEVQRVHNDYTKLETERNEALRRVAELEALAQPDVVAALQFALSTINTMYGDGREAGYWRHVATLRNLLAQLEDSHEPN